MRVVFMGTPEFSVPILTAIIGHGYEVVAVYTQPPRPAGRRGLELTKSPVHEKAEQFGIPVFTPKSLKGAEEQEVFASLKAHRPFSMRHGSAAIMVMPRFCRAGAGPRPSSAPSWRAMRKPA